MFGLRRREHQRVVMLLQNAPAVDLAANPAGATACGGSCGVRRVPKEVADVRCSSGCTGWRLRVAGGVKRLDLVLALPEAPHKILR
jgi:hypothetical protein